MIVSLALAFIRRQWCSLPDCRLFLVFCDKFLVRYKSGLKCRFGSIKQRKFMSHFSCLIVAASLRLLTLFLVRIWCSGLKIHGKCMKPWFIHQNCFSNTYGHAHTCTVYFLYCTQKHIYVTCLHMCTVCIIHRPPCKNEFWSPHCFQWVLQPQRVRLEPAEWTVTVSTVAL